MNPSRVYCIADTEAEVRLKKTAIQTIAVPCLYADTQTAAFLLFSNGSDDIMDDNTVSDPDAVQLRPVLVFDTTYIRCVGGVIPKCLLYHRHHVNRIRFL